MAVASMFSDWALRNELFHTIVANSLNVKFCSLAPVVLHRIVFCNLIQANNNFYSKLFVSEAILLLWLRSLAYSGV